MSSGADKKNLTWEDANRMVVNVFEGIYTLIDLLALTFYNAPLTLTMLQDQTQIKTLQNEV